MQSIAEEVESKPNIQKQSEGRINVSKKVIDRFYDMREMRNKRSSFFRNRTFLEYIEDSLKRINQYKEKPSYKKWWQANMSGSTTRNKLIGILSKLAANAMVPQVVSDNDISFLARKKEQVANYLLKKANYKNKDDKKLVLEMFECMAKGTVVGFEGWKYEENNARVILDEDPQTGELKFKEEKYNKWNDVYGEIVPLEDIYFGDIYVNDIQDMDDIIWRTVLTKTQFDIAFEGYPDADKVVPKNSILAEGEDKTIFYQCSDDINEDEVEILRYFNQSTDEFIIIANGIWINPIKNKTISPIPFNHGRLPFWSAVFELLDAKYIYGKSIADKMIADQDMEDKVFDNILDRLTMALKAPIVASGLTTSLTDGYLEPDKVLELGENNINAKVERLNLQEPGQGSFSILDILARRLEQTSISSEVAGASGSGNKTARQVLIEREGALQLVSLFLKFMEFGERDKYILRLSNIFQFYTLPSHKKDNKFRKMVLRNERMSNGKIGNIQLEFVNKITTNKEEEMIGGDTETIQITPQFIKDFEADIVMVQRSSISKSEELEQAKEIEFQKTVATLYPDLYNREVGFQDLISKFRDKNYNALKKEVQQQPTMPEFGAEMGQGGVPAGNMGNPTQLEGLDNKSLKELI
jgi:hypothetical protein